MFEYFFSRESMRSLERKLRQGGYGRGLNCLVRDSIAEGAIAMLLALTVMLSLNTDDFYITLVCFSLLPAPLVLNYFYRLFKAEKRKMEIERLPPDILLQASIFPKKTSMEKIIGYLSKAGYPHISAEFSLAGEEIRKGATVRQALENMMKRNDSRLLDRALGLLVQGYESGADLSDTFRETAEDLMETNSILRERNANMIIEKYTLLFAGGFIVPMVLGLIVGMVSGFDFALLSNLGIGMDAGKRQAVLEAALTGNSVYIAEYALLASVFVANTEGNIKKAFLYAVFLLPVSLVVYGLAQLL